MSEYYARGRAVFADATSFVFFLVGFLAAAPFAWPALRLAFEVGEYDRGLAVFAGRIFGSGLAMGVLGYVGGALAGRTWQGVHEWRRARRQANASGGRNAQGPVASPDGRTAVAPSGQPDGTPRRAPAPMTCRVGLLTPSNCAAFARRVGEGTLDRRYSETSTTETLTLAAWDGLDIAGVARLLSDGYGTLVITDCVVDPYYDRTDVADRLIAFALERVPKGGRLTRA